MRRKKSRRGFKFFFGRDKNLFLLNRLSEDESFIKIKRFYEKNITCRNMTIMKRRDVPGEEILAIKKCRYLH